MHAIRQKLRELRAEVLGWSEGSRIEGSRAMQGILQVSS